MLQQDDENHCIVRRQTSWLDYNGVPSSISMTHGDAWLTVTDVPVFQANELLGASYQLYQHAGMKDTTILRTVSYRRLWAPRGAAHTRANCRSDDVPPRAHCGRHHACAPSEQQRRRRTHRRES